MNDNKKNIDQFFLEQLGNATERPPSSVWDSLEKRLEEDRPHRRFFGWWFYISIGILLIGAGGAAYYIAGSPSFFKHSATQSVAQTNNQSAAADLENSKIKETKTPLERIHTNDNPASETEHQYKQKGQKRNARIARNEVIPGPGIDHTTRDTKPLSPQKTTTSQSIIPKTAAKNSAILPHQDNRQIEEKQLAGSEAIKVNRNKTLSEKSANTVPELGNTRGIVDTSIKMTNDREVVNKPRQNKKEVIAANKMEQNNLPAEHSIVRHSVQIKNTTDTSYVVQNKPVHEKNIASKYTIQRIKATPGTPIKAHKKAVKISAQTAVVDSSQSFSAAKPGLAGTNKKQDQKAGNAPNKIAHLSKNNTSATEQEQYKSKAPDTKETKVRKPLNISVGIKGGYENGFNSFTARKYTGTIFGELQLSDRWSFLLQPGIKVAQLNRSYTRILGNFFQAGPTTSELYHVNVDSLLGLRYDFAYKQTYDSMIASIEAKRNFVELELPFLFRYKINHHFSAMAGLNLTFGKIVLWNNNIQTIHGLILTDTVLNNADTMTPAASSKFSHPGSTPFSNYSPSSLPKNTSPVRFGYSLGLTYTFREKVMLDLLLQQNLSGYRGIQEPDIRKIFAQPYIRLSLGYTLFGSRKK